jgi:hypothetical protein
MFASGRSGWCNSGRAADRDSSGRLLAGCLGAARLHEVGLKYGDGAELTNGGCIESHSIWTIAA